MDEVLKLLQSVGVPTGIAGFIILSAITGDALLKRYAETKKADGEDSRAERKLLASDQAEFRKTLIEQNESLREQLREVHAALEGSVARHLEAERRVVEFQLTIARLAATLISSGLTVPAGTVPDLAPRSLPGAAKP